ncbi:unnamed protein product [Rangifer tarandus platyrhynchus]|uniref:Uncharacterized protein n=1 Tax=Rangifer tarandus platyrhynchus TaxID=3082113 RepID=A0ABN8YVT6_RANTA|nr:unnamed protein product [Rangifer tarandus platyrhynchus]
MWSVAQENGSSPALRTVPSTSASKATSEKEKRPLRPEAPRQSWRAASRALPQIRFNVKSQFNAAENRLDELSLSPQLPPALGISECPDRQAGNLSLQINQNTTAPSSSPGRQDWSQTSSPPVTPGPNSPAPPARSPVRPTPGCRARFLRRPRPQPVARTLGPGSSRPGHGLLTSWGHPPPRGAAAAPAGAARTSRSAQFHAPLGHRFTALSPPLRPAAAGWRRVEKGKVARRHRRGTRSQRGHPSAHPGAPPA